MYDAIVIGGGPSGLIFARELSRKFHILLIEKGEIGNNHRAYTTSYDLLKRNNLEKYVVGEADQALLKYGEIRKKFKHKVGTVDEKKLFIDFKREIIQNNSSVHEKEEVIGYRRSNGKITKKSTLKLSPANCTIYLFPRWFCMK